jgi:hypothetical protein
VNDMAVCYSAARPLGPDTVTVRFPHCHEQSNEMTGRVRRLRCNA